MTHVFYLVHAVKSLYFFVKYKNFFLCFDLYISCPMCVACKDEIWCSYMLRWLCYFDHNRQIFHNILLLSPTFLTLDLYSGTCSTKVEPVPLKTVLWTDLPCSFCFLTCPYWTHGNTFDMHVKPRICMIGSLWENSWWRICVNFAAHPKLSSETLLTDCIHILSV